MALVFNDEQIKNLSKDYLGIDSEIENTQQSLLATDIEKQNNQKKDETNIVFQDNFYNIIHQYHFELSNLNGFLRSDYDKSLMIPSARQDSGNVHFPEGWPNMQPKLISSINGLPISVNPDNELSGITRMLDLIGIFTVGFSDGSATSTTTASITGNIISVSSAVGFSIGNRVFAADGSTSIYGKIINISGDDLIISTIFKTSSNVPFGADVKNFFGGYPNAQRESLSPSSYGGFFNGIRESLDNDSKLWIKSLSNQLDSIKANDSNDSELLQASLNIGRSISAVRSWQNGPSSGSGVGRYGDIKLGLIQSEINTRKVESINRVAQIGIRLGSVTQQSNGAYGGSGHYLNLFKWIDMRLNFVAGSLTAFYSYDFTFNLLNNNILSMQRKKEEFNNKFVIQLFAQDSQVSNTIKLNSVGGFVAGRAAKIVADDQSVISATIQGISLIDKSITFDKIIPSTFKKENSSRVFMQK